MPEREAWWERLISALGSINKVFTVLVLAIAIAGIALVRIVPTLDGRWIDPRLWMSLLLIVSIMAIVVLILRLMKTDPARLLEPRVEGTTIQDSVSEDSS